jgi:hypothetical protein
VHAASPVASLSPAEPYLGRKVCFGVSVCAIIGAGVFLHEAKDAGPRPVVGEGRWSFSGRFDERGEPVMVPNPGTAVVRKLKQTEWELDQAAYQMHTSLAKTVIFVGALAAVGIAWSMRRR